MIALARVLMVALICAGATVAQTKIVIPAGLDAREGSAASWVPTKYNLARVQYLYGSSVMPKTKAVIRSLRLRRDGESTSSYIGYAQEVEIHMSTLPNEPVGGYSMTWADNRGADYTCVLAKTTVIYPVVGPVAVKPATFAGSVEFKLDTPFTYPGAKPFLLEFTTHATQLTVVEWLADAEAYSGWNGAPTGFKRTYSGTGCPAGFRNYGTMPHIGGRWHHYGYCQATGTSLQGLDLIGFDNKSLGALPLPFDLTPLGAEGCRLYLSPLLVFPSSVDPKSPTGRINFELGTIPNNPTLVGVRYFEQQIVLEKEFNDLGLRVSRLAECTIGSGFTGSVAGFQFLGYGPYYQLYLPWATWYSPKLLVVELGL